VTAVADYHSDFYVAVATLIPVVWLTTGFSLSRSTENMLYVVRAWRSPDKPPVRHPAQGPVGWFLYPVVASNPAKRRLLTWARRSAVGIFFVAGLIGEIAAITALAYQYPGHGVRLLTFVCVIVLVVIGAGILGTTLWLEVQRLIIDSSHLARRGE
jgi:hypothetical protein